ncbi:NrtR DNA-binding winged helix domain-containing protein [Telluribacter sp. SYSU D00476]|uniref:NUDIX hydrolase n=1 Tax=Telluribacter sp. SYSU D00476 TaxID=2811430 RepID=UPI001FF54CAC|nr:NUDIX domain-containing protein [Telluribacter sp. SYSU D00476]
MQIIDKEEYIQQLSIDCVIFGYQNNHLKVLVPKLVFEGDFWALPGGFTYQHEGIDQAARRILESRTGIRDIYLEQFWAFGDTGRSNQKIIEKLMEMNEGKPEEQQLRQQDLEWVTRRFISIGYYALVDINKVVPQKADIDESIGWYDIGQLPPMIMDHKDIVSKALDTLRLNLDEKLIAFNLLPETFTMKEVQELYETIYDKPFARNNFQKKILDLNVLERLDKKYTGAANKAPYLYRFRE